MDIVYVLGSGSEWDDNEIRFSLRSVEKYLTGVGNVYIIGKKPNFLKDIIHRSVPDSYKEPWRMSIIKLGVLALSQNYLKSFCFLMMIFICLKVLKLLLFPYIIKGLCDV